MIDAELIYFPSKVIIPTIFYSGLLIYGVFLAYYQLKLIRRKDDRRLVIFMIFYGCCLLIKEGFFILFLQIYPNHISIGQILSLGLFMGNFVLNRIKKLKDIPNFSLPKIEKRKIRSGDIKLGTIFQERKAMKGFKLQINDLQRHMLIYGQTGTGKTNFVKHFLKTFTKSYPDIPFILFEFKGEYQDLVEDIPSLKVIKPGTNFSFNIFDHDTFRREIYVEVLFDGLKSCQIIENNSDFSPQMEKVLVDVLRILSHEKENKSWDGFLEKLDQYVRKNDNKIPMLQQTAISLKNRLRRYYEGSLKNLFNFTPEANKISELLTQNCIIDLGNILKMGGSKGDVIFFANLILKWIWENDIKKKSTDVLEHLTVFEDASYIASKKILETSKLSSYLEDIALLLRGKGEALISITTTLEISRNILLNSGSKFFFKFNEKLADVIHYIGLSIEEKININELSIGYCIAKIDSIPQPFLLKTAFFRGKKKETKKVHPLAKKKKFKFKDSDKKALTPDNRNRSQKKTILNQDRIDSLLNSMWKIVNNAVDYYLSRNYEYCAQEIFRYWNCVQNSNNLIFTTYRKSEDFQELEKFVDRFKKKRRFTSDELQFILNCFKNMNITLQRIGKSSKIMEEFPKQDNNLVSPIENDILGIDFHHFIKGNLPEKIFSLGKTKLPQPITEKIYNYFQFQGGKILIEIDSFLIFLVEFEIYSAWSKTGREYLGYSVFIEKDKFPSLNLTNSIQTIILNFIKSLEQNHQIYAAFYLTNKKYRKRYNVLIKDESIQFKLQLKAHFCKIVQDVTKQVCIKKQDTTRNNFDQYVKLNKLIQSLIFYEKEPLITNAK